MCWREEGGQSKVKRSFGVVDICLEDGKRIKGRRRDPMVFGGGAGAGKGGNGKKRDISNDLKEEMPFKMACVDPVGRTYRTRKRKL